MQQVLSTVSSAEVHNDSVAVVESYPDLQLSQQMLLHNLAEAPCYYPGKLMTPHTGRPQSRHCVAQLQLTTALAVPMLLQGAWLGLLVRKLLWKLLMLIMLSMH